MTRKLALFATTAVMATVPQIAQASCSGNACSAYSAIATWSSSDKHVNAVLTNKDQTKAVHLKFCITVEGKCNSFDLTLPPHGTMTKSVSVSGGAAPPKFAVDVSTAEFPAGQAAASQGSTVANAVDSPFGKLTYLTTHNDGPMLSKAVADFVQGGVQYKELEKQVANFNDAYQKVGSLKEIEAEVRKTVHANPMLRLEAGYAKGLQKNIEGLAQTFRLVAELADHAARDLSVSEKELEAVRDRETADQLMAEAEKERQQVSLLIGAINSAITAFDVVKKWETGDIKGIARTAWGAADKVADLFTNSSELIQRAKELETKARRLSADAAAQRFKDAEDHLSKLKEHGVDLKQQLQQYKAEYDQAVASAQGDFDKDNARNKGRFNFANITQLIEEAKAIKKLAAATWQDTNAAREYMKMLYSVKNKWMADPAQDEKIMQQIFDTTTSMIKRIDEMRRETEVAQAKLQETYAKAMQLAGP